MNPIDRVLDHFPQAKQHGKEWQALCPAHEDRQASLSISEGDDGRCLIHCHAGCEPATILDAVGLKLSDLYLPMQAGAVRVESTTRIDAVYKYLDAEGAQTVFEVVRYSPKAFKQRVPKPVGGYTWSLKGVNRVLYQLPMVVQRAARGALICIVEGEKDVHSLHKIDVPATCNAGGAGKWQVSYSESLTGAEVIILPDNDESGRKHAETVAQALQGYAKRVRVLELPGVPEKGDVSDWIAAGGTKQELIELINACPEWEPKPIPETRKTPTGDFPLTDLGNAERLIAAHGANPRFDVNRGAWLVWNGKRWEYDADYGINRLAANVVRSMCDLLRDADENRRKALFAHIQKSESAPRLSAMVKLASEREGVPVLALSLDHDPWLLNCLNGTVDLRTGNLRTPTREDLITKLAPVEYDPAATCPRWIRFLDEVFQGNQEIIGFVKRMAGYCLTADTREQSVFIFTGKGQNGKGRFVEPLRTILGDYAGDTPVSTFTERRESNTADLAALMGKRLVTASEGEETQSFNESLLKTLSGEDPITCRELYQKFFTYTPTFKVVFSTNEIPRIRSQNFAMKRRIKLIPFRQRFYDPEDKKTPVKDSQLLPKLLVEKNGILAWMVQGCLEWREHGLMTPDVIREEVNRLFESQDLLAEFLDERCKLLPDEEVEVSTLWKDYLLWCQETGRKQAFKQPQGFSRSLTQRDGIDRKKGTGGVRSSHRNWACACEVAGRF